MSELDELVRNRMNYCLIGESWLTDYLLREWYNVVYEINNMYHMKELVIYSVTQNVNSYHIKRKEMISFEVYDEFDKKKAKELLEKCMNKNKFVFVQTEHPIGDEMKKFFEENRFEVINLYKEIGNDIEWAEFYKRLERVLKGMKYPKYAMNIVQYEEIQDELKELDEKKPRDPVKN